MNLNNLTIKIINKVLDYTQKKSAIYVDISGLQNSTSFNRSITIEITDQRDNRFSKTYNLSSNSSSSFLNQQFNIFQHDSQGYYSHKNRLNITITLGTQPDSHGGQIIHAETITIDMIVIPKKTTCPQLSGVIGEISTLHISSESTDFTHDLYIKPTGNDGNWTLIASKIKAGKTYNLPQDLLQNIPYNSQSKTVPCKLDTYYGNDLIGSTTNTYTYYGSNELMSPTIPESFTLVDVNPKTIALTNDNEMIVKGFSIGKFTLNKNEVIYKYGALFQLMTLKTATGRAMMTTVSDLIINANNLDTTIVNIGILDSRGFITQMGFKGDISKLINYFTPKIDLLTIKRPIPISEDMILNIHADYFDQKFGENGIQNALIARWRVKANNGSFCEWQNLNSADSSNAFSMENFTVYENDGFSIKKVGDTIVINGTQPLNSDGDKDSITIGKIVQGLSLNEDFSIKVNYVSGDVTGGSEVLRLYWFGELVVNSHLKLGRKKNFSKTFKATSDYTPDSRDNSISITTMGGTLDNDGNSIGTNPTFNNYTIKIELYKNPASILAKPDPINISNPLTGDGLWNYTYQYQFEFELSDKLTSQVITKTVYSSLPIYDFWEDSDRNKHFEVNGTTHTRKLEVSEEITIKGKPIDYYSTEESDTNKTWIDNKKIYRKVFEVGYGTTVDVNIIGIKDIVNLRGIVKNAYDSGWRPIPWLFNYNANTEWMGGLYYQQSTNKIYLQLGEKLGDFDKCYIIMEYTKE